MSRSVTLLVVSSLATFACSSPAERPAPTLGAGLRADPAATAPGSDAWITGTYGVQSQADTADHDPDRGDGWYDDLDTRHVTLLFGRRSMDDGDWDPVEDQWAGGLQFDAYDWDTGHGFEVGTSYSKDSDDTSIPPFGEVDVKGSTLDLYGGYRHTFNLDDDHDGLHHDGDGLHDEHDHEHAPHARDWDDDVEVHPYLAGGVVIVRADVDSEFPGSDDDDVSPGLYVRAGIGFDLDDEGTRLGLDYRHTFLTDIDIGGIGDANSDQLMLTLGWAF